MTSFDLLRRYGAGRELKVALIAFAGGFLGAAIVAVSNAVLAMDDSEGSLFAGLLFLLGLAAMFACNRWSARVAIEIFEDIQSGVRNELAKGLRVAPLRAVEKLGALRGQVVGALVLISNSVTEWVTMIQHTAFLACMTLIIASISARALGIWLLTCLAMALVLIPGLKRVSNLQEAASARSGEQHARLDELLDGFKQVKLDPRAGETLIDDIKEATAALYRDQAQVAVVTSATFLRPNALFFALGFGLAVFAPAETIGLGPVRGYEMSILLALSLGPLSGLLQALPAMSKTTASAHTIAEVLDLLRADHQDAGGTGEVSFDVIELAGLRFAYTDTAEDEKPGFVVGPIDLKLKRGALVFVTGGNGSGKTTLMKMLLGLYPTKGIIRWDGHPVCRDNLPQYRGLFTAVFSGQHLFDRLYGLDVPPARVTDLLERLQIADVVDYDDNQFDNLKLSSGQKMRLAMVVALLEDRPICVFDEWTANQAPETTRFYHDTLLPELLAQGKTVIGVSHDDRFFARADHLVRVDRGKMVLDQYRAGT